jgi:hypothetical protein
MIDVYGTHVDILLVSTGPDALDLEIELWERATGYLLVQITQKIKLLLEAQKCVVNFFIYIFKQKAI